MENDNNVEIKKFKHDIILALTELKELLAKSKQIAFDSKMELLKFKFQNKLLLSFLKTKDLENEYAEFSRQYKEWENNGFNS